MMYCQMWLSIKTNLSLPNVMLEQAVKEDFMIKF